MLRTLLLGTALSALAGSVFLSTPAEATPICVEGQFTQPPRTIPPICLPYPLETACVTQNVHLSPVLEGWVKVCLPSPLINPPAAANAA